MLILESRIGLPTGLAFAPDGQSLIAAGDNRLQVWPRWLDAPARAPVSIPTELHRYAFTPDGRDVYVYMSGNSRTRVWNITTRKTEATTIPDGGPAWFHFTTEGGFVLSSHNNGQLTRFDYAPNRADKFRKVWSIARRTAIKKPKRPAHLGSHYAFGAISGAAGRFVAMEYRLGPNESVDGLVVRSVADGAVVYRKKITRQEAETFRLEAGSELTIHPSGRYFAFPQGADVRLYPLARGIKLPKVLEGADLPIEPPKKGKRKIAPNPPPVCHGVAFHPSGALLAAVGNDGTVKLYDTTTWQVVRTFAWGIGPLTAVCFPPDGTRAATITPCTTGTGRKATGGKIVVWDMD
jgi:WD40 repeat protein